MTLRHNDAVSDAVHGTGIIDATRAVYVSSNDKKLVLAFGNGTSIPEGGLLVTGSVYKVIYREPLNRAFIYKNVFVCEILN